ncbi:MAG: ATP-binding protein [Gammaproteobacteria bacterium]
MSETRTTSLGVGNEKTGMGMIAATLAVILFAIGVFLYQQRIEDVQQIQRQGTGLVRLLSSMTTVQLAGETKSPEILRLLKETPISQHFAYVAVVDLNGKTLGEVVGRGGHVAPMIIPLQPSQWLGEREYQAESGRVKEYYAPVIESGELKAFVRLGYNEPGYSLNASQARLLAILSMAIFMLAPIFYFLIRNEIKPLASISQQLQQLLKKAEPEEPEFTSGSSPKELMDQFSAVIATAYRHISTLETKQTNSVVSSKLLEYQKARLESALNALPYAILVADETGQVTYTSNRVHDLLGSRHGEILGNHLSDVCDNRQITDYLVQCQSSNGVRAYQHDEADIYLDEIKKRVLINAYPLFSHKSEKQLIGTVIVFRDVTNEGVEQKMNGDFVAHVAHEMKSPLNVLFMYSETLIDNADASRELTIEAANIIHDETERLSQMIDNLLNLTMIELGTVSMRRQRIKVAELLEDIYQTMSRSNHASSIKFELNIPHGIGALPLDKNLVRICINNLISNAIKYNSPGGKIVLSAEENDTEIMISVRDTGIGISEEDQSRIFSKFYRSENDEVRKRTGHGLGLSLVNEIVKLHHGKIQVISQPGKGAEFILRFNKESSMLKDAI